MMQDIRIFALYKGDEFIAVGTLQEISESTGKSIKSLKYMTFPYYKKKIKNSNNASMLYLLEEDE